MAVNVETISTLERRMTISVPLAPLETQIKQRLSQLAKTAKFAGFRPGKAPLGLVNQQYGNQVRDEVYSGAVEKALAMPLMKTNSALLAIQISNTSRL